jgi:cytidylate kinase
MIVTVSGEIGAGKSTVAKTLARALGLRYISTGEIFREEASRRGLSLVRLGQLAEQDQTIDRDLDRMQVEAARGGGVLIESRLSGWLIDGDLRVWLRAALSVRAARVAARDGLSPEEALRELRTREESERRRYREIYQIDLTDLSRYHVIIDTGAWGPDEIVDALLALTRRFQPERSGRPS